MLIPRQELSFNFQGQHFDLSQAGDRDFLGWVFNQFLYGEVTGIQCGYWLYQAPHLQAASFLARQASEELSHVKRILMIMDLLGQKPSLPHWAIRYLATEMMGGSWGEHVTLEMAIGEGLVLTIFYALADTIDDEKIKKILESAVLDEEKHVEFGEKECRDWLLRHPEDRNLLLSSALLQLRVMRRFKASLGKRISQSLAADHPVMSQWDRFFDHILWGFERRIERLELMSGRGEKSIQDLSSFKLLGLLLRRPWYKWRARRRDRNQILTQTYLQDPWIRNKVSRMEEADV